MDETIPAAISRSSVEDMLDHIRDTFAINGPHHSLKRDHDFISYQDCIEGLYKIPTIDEVRFFKGTFDGSIVHEVAHIKGRWASEKAYRERFREINGTDLMPVDLNNFVYCNMCWKANNTCTNFCPNCGADMREISVNINF